MNPSSTFSPGCPCSRRPSAVIRRLADTLVRVLNIAEGRELVCLIGSGHERNNREAVLCWVARAVANPSNQEAALLLPRLVNRLENELREKGEWAWY